MQKRISFTETALRDAQQSLMATRMSTEEMVPILTTMDEVGYEALEVWGGATFDSCVRYLNEDPWERLRLIREKIPNTKLQMLLRGQNLLGYRHYSDDMVDLFIKKTIENGIDVIRIFDALNDPRNMEQAVASTKKYGAHAQLAICYTISPVHTLEYYLNLAKEFEKMGADSICVKDMAGILTPAVAKELLPALREQTNLPIELHTHSTAGVAEATTYIAVESGVNIIDTAISPLAGGTSQPATEAFNNMLVELGYETGLQEEKLVELKDYFQKIRNKYVENGTLSSNMLTPDPLALIYQVPGGMLSNLYAQLKDAGAIDRYQEVLEEVPRVKADLGHPPLVTPMSQMVGTQAVFNVLTGERYKIIPKEIRDYVRGAYGKHPGHIDEAIKAIILRDTDEIITDRPADFLEPEVNRQREEIGGLAKSDEDVLVYAMFPEIGKAYLEKRESGTPVNSQDAPLRIKASWQT
ncbi:oxaloacetate decarboxylase subunit alpha [Dolosicoccus paucivorans]|uniref:oxaloacetate decarboxylase subunit alpha n=1 Tax=Dolosicoccus paucivorans TaxID=84521 RepID=UPI0008800076|nr:oxaloacetate decarboxylase subunit alpha [Dolosicoccus paucivorans]SDI73810.1 oxaloacetate decarboxylase, alpha subunit [Dolosicoccus paucivorans]